MLKFKPPSSDSEYRNIQKEWDNIGEAKVHTSGRKRTKVLICFLIGILIYAGYRMAPYIKAGVANAKFDTSGSIVLNNFDGTDEQNEITSFASDIFDLLNMNTYYFADYQEAYIAGWHLNAIKQEWKDGLQGYESILNERTPHKSLEEAYGWITDLINYCLELCNSHDADILSEETLEDLNAMQEQIRQYLYEALEANDIQYTVQMDGSVQYWYKDN